MLASSDYRIYCCLIGYCGDDQQTANKNKNSKKLLHLGQQIFL